MSTTALLEKQAPSSQKTDEMPLVSICIPTYNGAKTIIQTLNSVLNQTYPNLEIIVCDDISPDNTVDVINQMNNERITVMTNPQNLGIVKNMNRCIQVANGKYVKILCQDDILQNDIIEKQVRAFTENDGVSIVTGASTVIDENDQVINKRRLYNTSRRIDGKKFARKSLGGRNFYGEPCIQLYETEKAKRAGIYSDPDLFYCVDWDAGIDMSYLGDVYYIADTLASFRISSNTSSAKMSKNKDPRIINCTKIMYEKHKSLGMLALGGVHQMKFELMVRLYSIARNLVIRKANG